MYEKTENYKVRLIPEVGFEVNGQWKDDIHDIRSRIVFDFASFKILEAEASALKTPFSICPQGLQSIDKLIGLEVGAGFNRQVSKVLLGTVGCVHLSELVMNSVNSLVQAASRGIPSWVPEKEYAQRWTDWIKMYKDRCIYFSQPGIFENSQEEIQKAFRQQK
ncbi:MAG: DUF2889 domain-containing protein [Syntrophomonadaceae bacterium]|nr:DUF2889 domain-containing protein [Syntrophomonadaceae bacterium]